MALLLNIILFPAYVISSFSSLHNWMFLWLNLFIPRSIPCNVGLTVCDLWYVKDLEEKERWHNQSVKDKGICRTSPATPGLLIMSWSLSHDIHYNDLGECCWQFLVASRNIGKCQEQLLSLTHPVLSGVLQTPWSFIDWFIN